MGEGRVAVSPAPVSPGEHELPGRYLDRLERRHGEWRLALRTDVAEWSGAVPALPLPFDGVADLFANGVDT
jgi:hypothetical protein